MIFVTLGTQDKQFDRLLREVKKIKNEKVIVQNGYTHCDSSLQHKDYFENDEFLKLMKEASVIITHGGVGSIIQALRFNKAILAAPRLKKYGEHTNDHQLQIVKEFEMQGYLLGFYEGHDINSALAALKEFTPKPFVSNTQVFVEKMFEYIESI